MREMWNGWVKNGVAGALIGAVTAVIVVAVLMLAVGEVRAGVIKPPVVPRVKQIVVCCDSITYGPTGGQDDSYRDELRALFAESGVTVKYTVVGASGTRCTNWVNELIDVVVSTTASVVLINCGTNDPTFTLEDRELLGQSYRQMIEGIHAAVPRVKILGSLIQISRVDPTGPLAWLPDNEIRANEVIAFNMDYYIPAWDVVGLVDFSVIPATVENNPDGIHPGPIGEQLYANAWFAEGRRLGWW